MSKLENQSIYTASRFEPSKKTLLVDRAMNHWIKFGGISVILAVFGIFLFIISQTIPLFQGAKVTLKESIELNIEGKFPILGIDEWSEKPLLIRNDGKIHFVDIDKKQIENYPIDFVEKNSITTIFYDQKYQSILFGTDEGELALFDLKYEPIFKDDERTIVPNIKKKLSASIKSPSQNDQQESLTATIVQAEYGKNEGTHLISALYTEQEQLKIEVLEFRQKRTLFGAGKLKLKKTHDLSEKLLGSPDYIRLSENADALVVVYQTGKIQYLEFIGGEFTHRQTFDPFENSDSETMSVDFLLGGVSLVITGSNGENEVWSLYRNEGQKYRNFGPIKRFESFSSYSKSYANSLRNKAFVLGADNFASLRYSTTESIRWESEVPFEIQQVAISGKYDQIVFLDQKNDLHYYSLKDPHPESSFKAFFGKIWYEGGSEPEYAWQSTGGTDEFEPKLSMIPLILGSLKGTLYALVFALPIAILSAIYTSQFAHPDFRKIIKPVMEVMASLPSVVLGFLAALWLAPLIEYRVPSMLMVMISLPVCAFLFGAILCHLPVELKSKFKPGYEFIVLFPVLVLVGAIAWHAGPLVEQIFFAIKDPETGKVIYDFKLWWIQTLGKSYEQRNSLVVGFVMGFAVIPIIFTITEDALTNVPPAMSSASLALGSSRWQTAMRIVVPTASAGILSAIMIGFGRAVGETMIVVMATGNTPIMDFNIFTGMRTLSANIAVELPEAPHHGTLYRTLFLGAVVLFMLTFVVNTFAEFLREHLRSKYKVV